MNKRHQAHGDPVEGLGDGAVYDKSFGTMWFNCGRGQFCAVKVRTASGKDRPEKARQPAEAVTKRVP